LIYTALPRLSTKTHIYSVLLQALALAQQLFHHKAGQKFVESAETTSFAVKALVRVTSAALRTPVLGKAVSQGKRASPVNGHAAGAREPRSNEAQWANVSARALALYCLSAHAKCPSSPGLLLTPVVEMRVWNCHQPSSQGADNSTCSPFSRQVYLCAVRLVTQLLRPGADLAALTATPGLLPALVDVLSAPLHEPVWLPGLLHTAELLQVSLANISLHPCMSDLG
jgi:hypothetical protein